MITPTGLSSLRPMAWGYVRISDEKQYREENSVPFQKERVMAYYQLALAPKGIDFAEIVEDLRAVSAYTVPFAHRKAGAELMRRMHPGDHLIIDKLDRIWRRSLDFHLVSNWFEKNEISLHIVNMHGMMLDCSHFMGKLIFSVLAAVAEAESGSISSRMKSSYESKRRLGIAVGKHPAPGTKHVVRKGQDRKTRRYVEWDNEERAMMAEIVRLVDDEQLSAQQVSDRLERHLAAKHGRPFSKSAFYQRYWTVGRVERAYWFEHYYRCNRISDVTQFPTNLKEDVAKFRQRVAVEGGYQNVYQKHRGPVRAATLRRIAGTPES